MNFVKTKKIMFLILIASSGAVECASYGRKAAAMLGAAAYWGASFAPVLCLGKKFREMRNWEKLADDDTTQQGLFLKRMLEEYPYAGPYAETELKKLGLLQARILFARDASALFNYILIDGKTLNAAESSLARIEQAQREEQEPMQDDLSAVQRFKGVLYHEANHLLHNDNARIMASALAAACIPVAARIIFAGARVGMLARKVPNVRKALQGMVNGLGATQILLAALRKIEYQADDAIQDHDALKGMIDWIKAHDAEYCEALKDKPWLLWIGHHMLTHPSPASRIEKLQSRLQEKE